MLVMNTNQTQDENKDNQVDNLVDAAEKLDEVDETSKDTTT